MLYEVITQISKITKVVKPDFKIFVGDSLAGNDTVNQAKEFFDHVKFDGSILTKSDADVITSYSIHYTKLYEFLAYSYVKHWGGGNFYNW